MLIGIEGTISNNIMGGKPKKGDTTTGMTTNFNGPEELKGRASGGS